MSPAPNPHPQSSKSASSPQSRTKDQANLAPEPSSPAEPMTDQPNSLLATPPTRKTPKDTTLESATPDAALTDDKANPSGMLDQPDQPNQLEKSEKSEKSVSKASRGKSEEKGEKVEVKSAPITADVDSDAPVSDAPDAADSELTDSDATGETASVVASTGEADAATADEQSNEQFTQASPEINAEADDQTADAVAIVSATEPELAESSPSESVPEPVEAELAEAEPATVEASQEPLGNEATPAAMTPPPPPRHQPIPPASEPMQYRAIGLVRGKYMPSEEQFTRGFILTEDEVLIDSVLLGRVMSLVKKHIDLEQSHLWVVYPRTRERDLELHMQIVGVWEPEKLNRTVGLDGSEELDESEEDTSADTSVEEASATASDDEILTPEAVSEAPNESSTADVPDDRYFSVRGEVVYQAEEEQRLLVKIRRAPKPGETEGKAFKVALKGTLTGKALGYFWDLQVQRQNNELVITEATQIGMVPPQKRSAGGRKPARRGPGGPPRRGGPGAGGPPRKRWQGSRDERPARSERGERPERSERPSTPKQPISKPVKRRPKAEES